MRGRLRRTASRRVAPVALCLLTLGSLARPAAAEDALTRSEEREFNIAFATQVGSGIYTVSGRTLQVYRLPFSYTLRKAEERHRGWRLTFPVTFGFYDFEAQDILDNGLAENVATVSLVPGVEFLLPLRANWLLTPYGQAGKVWDRSGDGDAWVYGAGVRSRADFPAGRFDVVLGNALNLALVDPSSGGRDSLVVFETALEARHLLRTGAGTGNADYGMYFVQNLYFDEPRHPFSTAEGGGVIDEYEVGITIGTRDPVKIWKIPLPRVGIGYLFGNGLSAFRIVFGTPAPSLQR